MRKLIMLLAFIGLMLGVAYAGSYQIVSTAQYGPGQDVVAWVKCGNGANVRICYSPSEKYQPYYTCAMTGGKPAGSKSLEETASRACD